MAWTYANWRTATVSAAITAVSTSLRTFSVSTDRRDLAIPGDRIKVDAGANIGTYDVVGVAYTPDTTTFTVSGVPASAVVAGNIVFGPSASSRLSQLKLHHAEVSARIDAAMAADGVSSSTDTLLRYLSIVESALAAEQRAVRGYWAVGQVAI